ncbi:MAG: hypothetical protein ABIJ61_13190 [bacterium]
MSESEKKRKRTTKVIHALLLLCCLTSAAIVAFDENDSSDRDQKIIELTQELRDSRSENRALEDSARSERFQLQSRVDSLASTLEPFERLAERYYPSLPPSDGLAELPGKIDSLFSTLEHFQNEAASVAREGVYRELLPSVRDSVVSFLRAVRAKYLESFAQIEIECHEGVRDRELVGIELRDLLVAAGFGNVRLRPVFVLGRSSSDAFHFECASSCLEAITALSEVLGRFIDTKYLYRDNPQMENGVVRIVLDGVPRFREDGSVWLR